MKLLFSTDLHGRTDYFQRLIDLACRFTPDLLVLGGDILPDADQSDPLGSQTRFVLQDEQRYLQDLRDRCPSMRVAAVLGNHEWLCSCQAMESLQHKGLLYVLHPDRPLRVGQYTFLGYSYAPPCPHTVKDFEKLDFPDQPYLFDGGVIWDSLHNQPKSIDPAVYLKTIPSMQEDLSRLAPLDTPDWVLVAHAPPAGTDLDVLPQAGHVGSRAVLDFILKRQPALSLHGHIHESPGLTGRFWQQLGSTISVNPGQRNDTMASVLVDLTDDTITLTAIDIERADCQPIVLPRTPVGRPA